MVVGGVVVAVLLLVGALVVVMFCCSFVFSGKPAASSSWCPHCWQNLGSAMYKLAALGQGVSSAIGRMRRKREGGAGGDCGHLGPT